MVYTDPAGEDVTALSERALHNRAASVYVYVQLDECIRHTDASVFKQSTFPNFD